MSKTALILGATGGAGREIALALKRHGWQLRALHRNPDKVADSLPHADWHAGDAMSAEDVAEASVNADLIVHAVNPPGYRNWDRVVLPMIDNTIAAATRSGARIILPGTIYNYGPDAFPRLTETSPQNPHTRKGAIRAEMEARLQRASRNGAGVVIVRAGDFFGPHTGSSWLSQGMVKPGRPVNAITYPGKGNTGHAWAYLPDFGETVARIVDAENGLGPFETFHFEGHWFEDGREIAQHIRTVTGEPSIPIRPLPWFVVKALSPVVPLFREMAEMKYLWDLPVRLDNTRLEQVIGKEPHTPIDIALRTTLEGMGCLTSVPECRSGDARLRRA